MESGTCAPVRMKLSKGALVKAIELVTYLNEREAASIDELTFEFEVSARTVRLHIQRTNEMLEGLAHISYARKQGGYVLSVINEEGFSEWLDRMHRFGDLDGSASRSASPISSMICSCATIG